uniref:Uncharacterized protein n=1 Tax=Rhizophora mucronata TaxID=61149 RepID=A0A2P2LDX3_RHIMU
MSSLHGKKISTEQNQIMKSLTVMEETFERRNSLCRLLADATAIAIPRVHPLKLKLDKNREKPSKAKQKKRRHFLCP